MNFNNFTIKSQEAVQKAVEIARTNDNQAIEPVHLLKAIITEGESVIKFIFQKLDINQGLIEQLLEKEMASFPKVRGSEPYLSNAANEALTKAVDVSKKKGD